MAARARDLLVVALEADQHADGRRQVAGATVHVRSGVAFEVGDPAELDLLADHRGNRLDSLGHGTALGRRHALERLGVRSLGLLGGVDDLLGELDEPVGLGDEVGLGVELDERAALGGDQTGRGGALGTTLGSLGGTLDAENLDGLVEVAVGFLERLLGVHHPGAGGVAELLDIGSGDSHVVRFLVSWCLR